MQNTKRKPTSSYEGEYRKSGRGKITLGKFTVIEPLCLLDSGLSKDSFIRIGERSKLKYGAVLKSYDGFIEIGNRVTIGEYSIIAGHGGVTIGKNTIIGGMCYISAQNHIHKSNVPIRFQGETANGIFIGDNVWIGGRVTVLDGVHIGNNSVIGAGSVVVKDIPSDSVAVGIPCRVVKKPEEPYHHTYRL